MLKLGTKSYNYNSSSFTVGFFLQQNFSWIFSCLLFDVAGKQALLEKHKEIVRNLFFCANQSQLWITHAIILGYLEHLILIAHITLTGYRSIYPWSLGLQLSCSSHSNLRKLTKFIEVVLLFTKFTPFLTQFHMQSQTIRRSEVQFFMGNQNFFFVPRFWQDEKTSFHNEEVTSIFLIGNNKMKIKIYKLILLNFLDHDAFNCILLISFRQ